MKTFIYTILFMSFFSNNFFAQKNVSLNIKIISNKTDNYIKVNVKNISHDTLIITNCLNSEYAVDNVYEDSLGAEKDYALYYKKLADRDSLARLIGKAIYGLGEMRKPYVKLAPNKTLHASFSYLLKEKKDFTIRVYNEKLKEGSKIIIKLNPNKFIEYKRKEHYYEIETKLIKTFWE
jgi:hypothetical protein